MPSPCEMGGWLTTSILGHPASPHFLVPLSLLYPVSVHTCGSRSGLRVEIGLCFLFCRFYSLLFDHTYYLLGLTLPQSVKELTHRLDKSEKEQANPFDTYSFNSSLLINVPGPLYMKVLKDNYYLVSVQHLTGVPELKLDTLLIPLRMKFFDYAFTRGVELVYVSICRSPSHTYSSIQDPFSPL